jgi:ATP-dependent RNA helicase DDX35
MLDPLLKHYSVLVIEDAHKRDIWRDVLIGALAKILKVRSDLRVIITLPTTSEVDTFTNHFRSVNTGVVVIDETTVGNKVEVQYLAEPTSDYVSKAVETVEMILNHEVNSEDQDAGDILVFLANRGEYNTATQELRNRGVSLDRVHKYQGSMDKMHGARQEPYIILATEDAVDDLILMKTLDISIRFVVDCGLTTVNWYNIDNKDWERVTGPIDITSAHLRARMAAHQRATGKCWRLYPESATLELLPETRQPEMHRGDLTEAVVRIIGLGIINIGRSFPFVSPAPPPAAIAAALGELAHLGALKSENDHVALTDVGRKISELPLPVPLSKAICEAEKMGCVAEMAAICSMSACGGLGSVLVNPPDPDELEEARQKHREFMASQGDHVTLLNIWHGFDTSRRSQRWCRSHYFNYRMLSECATFLDRLERRLGRLHILQGSLRKNYYPSTEAATNITRCLAMGYFRQVAKRTYNGFELATCSRTTAIPASSSVFHGMEPSLESLSSPWVVYAARDESEDAVYISGISTIERTWIDKLGVYHTVRE